MQEFLFGGMAYTGSCIIIHIYAKPAIILNYLIGSYGEDRMFRKDWLLPPITCRYE